MAAILCCSYQVYLGMSVEANHRLIDGVHIGRFEQTLTQRIWESGEEENRLTIY